MLQNLSLEGVDGREQYNMCPGYLIVVTDFPVPTSMASVINTQPALMVKGTTKSVNEQGGSVKLEIASHHSRLPNVPRLMPVSVDDATILE
jgi:hypothetical protein